MLPSQTDSDFLAEEFQMNPARIFYSSIVFEQFLSSTLFIMMHHNDDDACYDISIRSTPLKIMCTQYTLI